MKLEFAPILMALEQQKTIYKELLSLAYAKQKFIVDNDTIKLNQTVQQEIKCLSLINKAEGTRLDAVAGFAAASGLESKDMTLSHLIGLAEGQEKEAFGVLKKELTALLFELDELNKANHKLLETQLEYTETMLNVLLSDDDPLNNFYSGDGNSEKEKKQKAGFFDQQI